MLGRGKITEAWHMLQERKITIFGWKEEHKGEAQGREASSNRWGPDHHGCWVSSWVFKTMGHPWNGFNSLKQCHYHPVKQLTKTQKELHDPYSSPPPQHTWCVWGKSLLLSEPILHICKMYIIVWLYFWIKHFTVPNVYTHFNSFSLTYLRPIKWEHFQPGF